MSAGEHCRPLAVDVFVHRRTLGDRGAMLVSLDGDAAGAVWIPKSQVIDEDAGKPGVARGGDAGAYAAVLTIPEWLAIEKGLVEAGVRSGGMNDLFGGAV